MTTTIRQHIGKDCECCRSTVHFYGNIINAKHELKARKRTRLA